MAQNKIIKNGALVYVPRVPLAFWSRIGDPSFWKLGVVVYIDGNGYTEVYSEDKKIERLHKAHVREVL